MLLSLQDIMLWINERLNLERGELLRAVTEIVFVWIGVAVFMMVMRLVVRRIMSSVDDEDEEVMSAREKRGQTIAYLLQSVSRVVAIVIGLIFTVDVFIDVTPLLAGAGILGLAFSFGAQSLVKDLISGFFILMENQFAVGDIIEISGKSGVVEEMTMRIVQIRDLEGVLHTIPNGEIITVSNKTRGWSRAVLEIGIGYGEKLDHALEVFREEAEALSTDAKWKHRVDGAPEVSGVESLGDNAVVIRTLIRTIPGAQWETAREFRRRMKNRLDAEGIEMPFPQRIMHIRVDDARIADALANRESDS